jgi:hypothetical protein
MKMSSNAASANSQGERDRTGCGDAAEEQEEYLRLGHDYGLAWFREAEVADYRLSLTGQYTFGIYMGAKSSLVGVGCNKMQRHAAPKKMIFAAVTPRP